MRVVVLGGLAAVAVACGGQSVFDLAVGTCFDRAASADGTLTDVPAVDCSEPHDNEVYANWDLTQAAWPGPTAVRRLARSGCIERFEDWVGTAPESSELQIETLHPTESSWFDAGDRQVTCVVRNEDRSPLVGTTRDSAR